MNRMFEVEVTRGALVESRHLVAAAIVRADGTRLASWGDVDAPVYPRSALKPLQALPLLASGAADAFGLEPKHLALACASHNGEAVHVAIVRGWLDRLGLAGTALECGTHPPIDAEAVRALAGAAPGPEHNNCSGKHCGLLSLALHHGAPTQGYIGYDHPVQRELRAILSPVLDVALDAAPWGVDGCGIPNYGIPLAQLALGFARLSEPSSLPPSLQRPAQRVTAAMLAEPYLVAGRGRFDTAVMEHRPGALIVKGGAEGVCAAGVLPDGLGIALKVADGARRAVDVAMAALLRLAGVFDAANLEALARYAAPPIHNVSGLAVGALRAAFGKGNI